MSNMCCDSQFWQPHITKKNTGHILSSLLGVDQDFLEVPLKSSFL